MNTYKNSKIKNIKAREILDSKGNPTVEVELTTDLGKFLASVPSGTSKGKFEAKTKDSKTAVKNIKGIIGPKLIGKSVVLQKEIDDLLIKLDGTEDKSRLGANAILAVSVAALRAGAKTQKLPLWKWISKISGQKSKLPYPSVLQIEGGLHGKGGLAVQEFMTVFPKGSFKKSFSQGIKIYYTLKNFLIENYGPSAITLGLEGAFTPPIKETKEALDTIMEVATQAGFENKIKIILDAAASSFFKKNRYCFEKKNLNKEELLNFYFKILKNYPIIGIEDPFSEEDWQGWEMLMSNVKRQMSNLLVIGDDLTVTNPKRIKEACKRGACNTLIIKPNQIGTVSETITAAYLAKSYGWKIMVSHRSGETNDDFISDLSVGIGADFIKAGAPARGERVVKYNRLLRIEEELKK